jgi:hypothetical protein
VCCSSKVGQHNRKKIVTRPISFPLRVVCPICGARAGVACLGTEGPRVSCHLDRWNYATEQFPGEDPRLRFTRQDPQSEPAAPPKPGRLVNPDWTSVSQIIAFCIRSETPLTDWERDFLGGITTFSVLSTKQLAVLDKIYEKCRTVSVAQA